jgi:hypothetical protein
MIDRENVALPVNKFIVVWLFIWSAKMQLAGLLAEAPKVIKYVPVAAVWKILPLLVVRTGLVG